MFQFSIERNQNMKYIVLVSDLAPRKYLWPLQLCSRWVLRLECNLTSDDLEYEIEEGADDHDPRSCEGGHELPGASFVVEDAHLSSARMKVKVQWLGTVLWEIEEIEIQKQNC